MKGLIKLFSVAAVAGAMASCSDDLSLSKSEGFIGKGDLYATLIDGDEATRMGVLENKSVVWSLGDQIKVYSPDALKSNSYNLKPESAGYASGVFNLVVDNGVASKSNLVAITASSSQEDTKVYADENGDMNLIAKIPAEFDQFEMTQSNGSILYWPLKVPYYGLNVSFNEDNSLNATMNPTAGLLKVDIKALPEGTKAIVLTTHWDSYIDGTLKDADVRKYRADYPSVIERSKKVIDDKKIPLLGGKDEALSGTLTCKLEEGTKLVIDEDFRHADTLRVNIDELEKDADKIIFIPVVAQQYERLTVLAVSDDSKEPYFWPNAEILKVFENQEIIVTGKYTLAEAAPVEFDATGKTTANLSRYIAEQVLNDRVHNINVVVKGQLTGNDGDVIFIANNIPGKSNVKLVFEKPQTFAFDIVEAEANYDKDLNNTTWQNLHPTAFSNAPEAPYNDVFSEDKARQVTIVFAEDEAKNHNIVLPSSNVVVDAVGKGIAASTTIAILGSNTKEVSGYTDEDQWNTPRNNTNAGIVMRGSNRGIYEILPGQLGHIYAKGNGYDDEIGEIQIDGTLIYPANIDLRVTDMLVKLIDYPALGANAEGVIYTTGNAAIKKITEGHTGHGNTIKVNASWTGKQLSIPALKKGYDQSEIFTAAQLQGMGRATHMNEGTSPAKYFTSGRLRSVWLGGSLFPWIGADVTKPNGEPIENDFEFNGRNTNLRNMVLNLYEPWLPVDCCCADNRVRVDANLGLISRVITTKTVEITDVDLSDVKINTQKFVIPNIGAICGLIDADGLVLLENNGVSSVRIDARGKNIGGAFGLIDSKTAVRILKDNTVSPHQYALQVIEGSAIYGKSWVKSEAENVGGAIGAIYYMNGTVIDYVPEVTVESIYVKNQHTRSMDDNVGGQTGFIKTAKLNYGGDAIGNCYVETNNEVYSDGGSNVGGLIGQADYQSILNTKIRGTVWVQNRIEADINEKATNGGGVNETGSNVGGLVGLAIIKDALTATEKTEIEGSVSTKYLIAENRNAGGFVGYFEADELLTENKNANTVTISQLLEATEGYVGGLYGYIRTANKGTIGTEDATKNNLTVTVAKIAGAKAVGGLIGATTENGNTESYKLYIRNNANSTIGITIPKWEITKAPWFFRTTGDRKMNGSFGTVIGWLNGNIDIRDEKLTVATSDQLAMPFTRDDGKYGVPDVSKTNPIFTDVAKVELMFFLQKISQSTEGYEDIWAFGSWFQSKQWVTGQGDWYWGDENGYVGVNNNSGHGSGSYILNDIALWGNVNYNLYFNWNVPIWTAPFNLNLD